jgi:hypothetical protein
MSPELQKQLIEKYPTLFKDRNKSPKESLMCFGCEFGDGWYKIFDNLCEYLTILSESDFAIEVKPEFKPEDKKYPFLWIKNPDIVFMQVKEKYGTMRVYWNAKELENYDELASKAKDVDEISKHSDRFYQRVDEAIEYVLFLSSKICEVCGKEGKLYSDGWCMTRCKEHIIERYGYDPDEDDENSEDTQP